MSSRVIVKGLPKDLSESGLLKHIKSIYAGNVTDCKIIRKHGSDKSRMFGFVGFKTEEDALKAVSALNQTYLKTKKLELSLAYPEGDSKIPRPWSATTKRKTLAVGKSQDPSSEDKNSVKKRKLNKAEIINKFSSLVDAEVKKQEIKKKGFSAIDNPELLSAKENQIAQSDTSVPTDDGAWLAQKTTGVKPAEIEIDKEQNSARLAAESGRVRVLNIPYDATEAELRSFMETLGEVTEITMPKADDDELNRGYAFVEYRFPQSACVALASLNKTIFQGRELKVEGAQSFVAVQPIAEELKVRGKCAAKRAIEEKKKSRSQSEKSWNLLYVSAATSVEVIAQQLGLDKDQMFDLHNTADSFAARAALAETLVLKQTRDWLAQLGLTEEYFKRIGSDLKFATFDKSIPRSKDTIIVKHLPRKIDLEELRSLFSRYGTLRQFAMSPTKTLIVARFVAESSAAKAFGQLLLHNLK